MNNLSDIGVAGLAVMGENLALNMNNKGFSVSVFNRTTSKVDRFLTGRGASDSINGFHTLSEFVASLKTPRKVMMMLRAGTVIDEFIDRLIPLLEPGDIIIDGGNSNYNESEKRMALVESHGFFFVGSGVSGGEEGALKGPSLMPGGSREAWPHIEQIFTSISAKAVDGSPCCAWIGKGGAGHFVKMVHNGIEYGDMQLICEAYHIMKDLLHMDADQIHTVFKNWNEGELASYLIEITAGIFAYREDDGTALIDKILDTAGQKGTGKWTVTSSLHQGTPLSLIAEAVFARFLSSRKDMRVQASSILRGPEKIFTASQPDFQNDLAQALYLAKIISYTQGFDLLQLASKAYNWDLHLDEIARIWRGGCIIRSVMLDKISDAFKKNPTLPNLLMDDYFAGKTLSLQHSLRTLVATAAIHGIPVPSHTSALSYFDGLRCERLPANLLQAQRDFFGAHTYERIDRTRGEFFHTNWTGEGGDTTSTTYTR